MDPVRVHILEKLNREIRRLISEGRRDDYLAGLIRARDIVETG